MNKCKDKNAIHNVGTDVSANRVNPSNFVDKIVWRSNGIIGR